MISEEGLKFVKEQFEAGLAESSIRQALQTSGWQPSDIEELITRAKGGQSELEKPGELIKRSFALYRNNFETILKILLPGFIIMFLGVFILPAGTGNQVTSIIPYPSREVESLVAGVWSVVQAVVTIFMSLALLSYAASDASLSAGDAWRKGSPYIFSYLWVSILESLAIVAGFILLIIPGIIFAGWFIFSHLLVIAENAKGTKALARSREYVKGRWWPIIGRMFLFGLCMAAIYIAFILLYGLINVVKPMPHLTNLLVNVLAVLISPLPILYLFVLYKSAKASRPILINEENK